MPQRKLIFILLVQLFVGVLTFVFWSVFKGAPFGPPILSHRFPLQATTLTLVWPMLAEDFVRSWTDRSIVLTLIVVPIALAGVGWHFFSRIWGRVVLALSILVWFSLGVVMVGASISSSI